MSEGPAKPILPTQSSSPQPPPPPRFWFNMSGQHWFHKRTRNILLSSWIFCKIYEVPPCPPTIPTPIKMLIVRWSHANIHDCPKPTNMGLHPHFGRNSHDAFLLGLKTKPRPNKRLSFPRESRRVDCSRPRAIFGRAIFGRANLREGGEWQAERKVLKGSLFPAHIWAAQKIQTKICWRRSVFQHHHAKRKLTLHSQPEGDV